jgi:2-keto-3-deoxy-L-rhamnonate aldolase RhmA
VWIRCAEPRDTLYTQKLALTSPTSGCRSVGIVRSRTQVTEFILSVIDFADIVIITITRLRVRSSVVVKALRYKPEGHGFESR